MRLLHFQELNWPVQNLLKLEATKMLRALIMAWAWVPLCEKVPAKRFAKE